MDRPDYRVAYAIAQSPVGPCEKKGVILQVDERVARRAGHHPIVRRRGSEEW